MTALSLNSARSLGGRDIAVAASPILAVAARTVPNLKFPRASAWGLFPVLSGGLAFPKACVFARAVDVGIAGPDLPSAAGLLSWAGVLRNRGADGLFEVHLPGVRGSRLRRKVTTAWGARLALGCSVAFKRQRVATQFGGGQPARIALGDQVSGCGPLFIVQASRSHDRDGIDGHPSDGVFEGRHDGVPVPKGFVSADWWGGPRPHQSTLAFSQNTARCALGKLNNAIDTRFPCKSSLSKKIAFRHPRHTIPLDTLCVRPLGGEVVG